jgi:DNA-directed RNA polymerase sigma subunit (sigma70/sigma32)
MRDLKDVKMQKKINKRREVKPSIREGETDPLALYLKQISQHPLLTIEDEQRIGEMVKNLRIQLGSSEKHNRRDEKKIEEKLRQQKNLMINSNLRLVVSIA